MGREHICRGSGDSGGDGTNNNLESDRTIDQQALLARYGRGKKNARGRLLGDYHVPRFLYLSRSSLAATSVGRSLALIVLAR